MASRLYSRDKTGGKKFLKGQRLAMKKDIRIDEATDERGRQLCCRLKNSDEIVFRGQTLRDYQISKGSGEGAEKRAGKEATYN